MAEENKLTRIHAIYLVELFEVIQEDPDILSKVRIKLGTFGVRNIEDAVDKLTREFDIQ